MENTTPQESAPWPPRRVALATLVVVLIAAAFWIFFSFRLVFFSLFTAVVLSTALEPLVDFLTRRGISRPVSILLISLVLFLSVVAMLIIITPLISEQWATITSLITGGYEDLRDTLIRSPSLLIRRLGRQLPGALPLTLPAPDLEEVQGESLDVVERAMAAPEDDPLYVVAIGAITNVASAVLIEPEIIRRIAVVWLGGQPVRIPRTLEFNMMQDLEASRLMFESGLPLVQIPCIGVSSHLLTTKAELEQSIVGYNPVADFLYERFCEYSSDHFAWAKEIWDISSIGYLLNEDWVPTELIPSPILNDDFSYSSPPAGRHEIRAAWRIDRNPIFKDLFQKLRAFGKESQAG